MSPTQSQSPPASPNTSTDGSAGFHSDQDHTVADATQYYTTPDCGVVDASESSVTGQSDVCGDLPTFPNRSNNANTSIASQTSQANPPSDSSTITAAGDSKEYTRASIRLSQFAPSNSNLGRHGPTSSLSSVSSSVSMPFLPPDIRQPSAIRSARGTVSSAGRRSGARNPSTSSMTSANAADSRTTGPVPTFATPPNEPPVPSSMMAEEPSSPHNALHSPGDILGDRYLAFDPVYGMEREKKELQNQFNEQKTLLLNQINFLQNMLNDRNEELAEERTRSRADLKAAQERYDKEKAAMQERVDKEKAAMQERLDKEKAAMQERVDKEKAAMQERHDGERKEWLRLCDTEKEGRTRDKEGSDKMVQRLLELHLGAPAAQTK